MERHADHAFETLKQELVQMASLAEMAIGNASHALLVRDIEMEERVLREDGAINRLEVVIDEQCLRMLALSQPETSDLRFIAMALKINNDLERVGDQAVTLILVSRHLERVADHATNLAQNVMSLVEGQHSKHHHRSVTHESLGRTPDA